MSGEPHSFSRPSPQPSHLTHAVRLGRQGEGCCAPNPSVGCVIVKNGEVVGLGRTAAGGRPHAEVLALQMAGEDAKDATLYVTLEPCAHHGKTPPCAEAIIAAGIAQVVVACRDPDPRVSGKGSAMLRAAGIEVIEDICTAEAAETHRGFFSRILRHRPWVSLKIATSRDGFIAKENGDSKWITGETARRHGHLLRARHDAILTGSGTYLTDSPQLTVRIAGLEDRSPQRFVLDRRGRIQHSAFRVQQEKTLKELLEKLAEEGINHLMVEAGAELSAAFLHEGLADELYWYRAPQALSKGIAFTPPPALPSALTTRQLGEDTLTVYRFTSPQSLIED